ncbi:unnamed protein product [Rotaria sordida]|uniref:BED-type domain-containing protein n=1 Tax=Rotaria sordida TaxID=392033 RepID=A0A819TW47_9BILA|nr:unnamed protein product [Rotaria sordida]
MNQSLTKNDILRLIKQRDKSIVFRKPKKSSKSSPVWEHFCIIVVNDIEQGFVCCDHCKELLVYRQRDGTTSMAKHKRSCHASLTSSSSCSDGQLTVTEYFISSKSSNVPKRIKDKIKLACTEFTALDCRAFELVTGEGFLKMAQSIFDAGRYFSHLSNINVKKLIPSPITISRNIDRLYEEKKVNLLNLCSSMTSYCIICDFWTEKFTGLSYCGLALRHVTKDFKLLNFILGCFLFDSESQSASNIRAFVDSQLLSFGLVLNSNIFVVTDNENKMRAAFKERCIRVGCSIHFVNKQLEHSFTSLEIDKQPVKCDKAQNLFGNAKRIVTHVRRSHRQIKLERKLQLYSDTRFNGAFYMLEVFFDVYDELAGVINKNLIDSLGAIDKDLLEKLCVFLKLFDQAIIQLSDEDKPTIHQVIPIRQLLINHCEIKYDDSDGLKEVKHFLGERIKSIWIPQDQHYMSTLLHPSLKHFHIAPHEKNKAIKLVKQQLLKRTSIPVVVAATDSQTGTSTTSSTFNTSTAVPSNDLLGRCFDQSQPVVKLANELDDYMLLETQLHETDDVLLFWKENAKNFPVLSSIVRDIFAIPASNTSVERLFSSSKNTVTDRRTSLAAEKVNKLLFLQKNLFSLAQINEKIQMQKQEQSKRRLSTVDDEQMLVFKNREDSTSTTSIKKIKKTDSCDFSSDDN